MTRRCEHCEFFTPSKNLNVGFCHRYPPTPDRSHLASFPIVHCTYWCGEFERDAEKTGGGDAP